MSPNASVELLFKCKMEGAAEIDRLAASVRGVATNATASAESLAGLEKAIQVLTGAVNANTASLNGMEGATTRVTTGLHNMAGGARVANAELRVLEGNMSILAAGRWLASFQSLQAVMMTTFPIFGAVALLGVIDQIVGSVTKWYDKYVELKGVQDELARGARALASATEESYANTEQRTIESLRRQGKIVEAGQAEIARLSSTPIKLPEPNKDALSALEDAPRRRIQDLYRELSTGDLQDRIQDAETLQRNLRIAGLNVGQPGFASYGDEKQIDAQKTAVDNLLQYLKQRYQQYETDVKASQDDTNAELQRKSEEAARKAQERARQIQEVEKQAHDYLESAQAFELNGLARVNTEYQKKLDLLARIAQLGGDTSKARGDIEAAHALEVQRETAKEVNEGASRLEKVRDWWTGHGTLDAATGAFSVDEKSPSRLMLTGYSESQEKRDQADVAAGLRVLMAGDQADADAVQRSIGATIRANGRGSQGAITGDYQARVSAAREIYTIETKHLDLIADEDKRDEAYANARKKRDEEIYRAAEQYEEDLQSLREKDLDRYRQMADSLFDALHSHSMNQWGREFVTGQARTAFSNVAQYPLQQIGHMLGSVTGGFNPGGIFTGTVFDPANRGASDAATTAKQTTRTADEVHALRGDLHAMMGGGSSSVPDGAPAGPVDIYNLPMNRSNPLSIFGSDISGWTGSGMSSPSGLSQLMGGLGAGGANPLTTLLTGWSTTTNSLGMPQSASLGSLSTAQQIGVGIGSAAELAGAGLTIASGISQGGVGGDMKAGGAAAAIATPVVGAIAKALGAASSTLSAIPVVGSIVAAALPLIGSFFTNGPQQRSQQITDYLAKDQYLAPTALNVMQGMNGTYEDFDAHGNLRTSTMSAVPTVAEPYITKRTINGQQGWYNAPGTVEAPYSGGATGTGQAPVSNAPQTVVIQAMDAQSFTEFAQRNSGAIGQAVVSHLAGSDGERLASEIRYHANG